MRFTIVAIGGVLLGGCAQVQTVEDVLGERAAQAVPKYCLLSPTLRAQKRAEFNGRLPAGHELKIVCPGDSLAEASK